VEIAGANESEDGVLKFLLSQVQRPVEDKFELRPFWQIDFLSDSRGSQKSGSATRRSAHSSRFAVVSGGSGSAANRSAGGSSFEHLRSLAGARLDFALFALACPDAEFAGNARNFRHDGEGSAAGVDIVKGQPNPGMPGQSSRLDPADMPNYPRANREYMPARSFQRLEGFHLKLLIHLVLARIHLLIETDKKMGSILDRIRRGV
jgi:hypothetical protein